MINLELLAQSGDHSIVQVCTIVGDDSVRDAIPANEVLLDEAGHHILCNGGEGSCLDPLGKVINGHQDETVSMQVDPAKVKAIQEMPTPKTEKEV